MGNMLQIRDILNAAHGIVQNSARYIIAYVQVKFISVQILSQAKFLNILSTIVWSEVLNK